MKRVMVESPWAGEFEKHRVYALRCMQDSLRRGESPFLSHLLYTMVLDDTIKIERRKGIMAGHMWMAVSDLLAVYVDYGISKGMQERISFCETLGLNISVEYRGIGENEPYNF